MTLQEELNVIVKECYKYEVIVGELERILLNHDSICPICKAQGLKEKVAHRFDLSILQDRIKNILDRVRIIRKKYV
jgi:hypothetical protein